MAGVETSMFDYLRKQVYAMLDLLLAPFWAWLTRSSWTVRFLVFFACALLLGAVAYPAVALDSVSRLICLYRAGTATAGSLPLSKQTGEILLTLQSHLDLGIRGDVAKLRSGVLTAWSSSQAIHALSGRGLNPGHKQAVTDFIRSVKVPGCACWHEMEGTVPGDPVCVFASGWVFSAMARMDVPAQPDELAYVLAAERGGGWWSMYPVPPGQTEFASTYATAWVILGLKAQLDKDYVSPAQRADVEGAINRGAAWLLGVRSPNARWRPYPNIPTSKVSETISGVVLHALHRTVPDQSKAVEQLWLKNLPAELTKIADTDPVYVDIKNGEKRIGIDQFIQIRLPWMLIATADAYSSGSTLDRSEALFWLERTFAQEEMANADADLAPWWRSEFLMGINSVLGPELPRG
jgi:hypothetical protein